MFKTIENTNYEISESGEVRRIYKNGNITILKPAITYNGYMYVNLYYINHGKRKKKLFIDYWRKLSYLMITQIIK